MAICRTNPKSKVATCQLNLFNLRLKSLINDELHRQNFESPGFGIPTVSRFQIFTDPPSALNCLILAPQCVKQIVNKNSAARDLGVVFAKVWLHTSNLRVKSLFRGKKYCGKNQLVANRVHNWRSRSCG